ncbi:two-component sensor histidine kinase [Chondrocystis sp. NIES-4102]|nr:two-component sensor histidine kinase [Chondrocystis sp. NIES-4102]
MAAATLVVSLIMSSLTFWAVNTIQQESNINDTRFGSDLSILIASNAAPLIAEDDITGLANFSNRFYRSTSSIRYLIYADESGNIFFGIPYSQAEVQNSLTIKRRIRLPEDYAQNSDLPFVRQHQTPNGQVTDVFVPLQHNNQYLGVLAVGINPNPTIVASSNLTRDVTIAVFITIWAMVILGNVFNALMITQPIKELLVGVRNIAAKNFKQRINLPLRGELGELIASFNLMAEKLEKYQAQNIEEITSEKAKLETLVSTIADGAMLIDPDLQIILANPTARSIFGWGEDAIGDNILHRLPSELTVKLTKPLYQMIDGRVDPFIDVTNSQDQEKLSASDNDKHHFANRDEFRLTLGQPASRSIRVLLSRVIDGGNENIKGIAMTVQDITREVELNEAKSQFISNISHELRTPLFNIKSFIETLAEYGEDLTEDQRKEFLDTANHETDRLTRLVNDVLDLSRLESSRTYELTEVDLTQPIEQTLRSCQLNAKDKGISLKQDIQSPLPSVVGNYDLLLQVLTNLVGNSLKFTNSGGKVTVRAYPTKAESNTLKQSGVRIEVVDTGIGISAEDKEAIFERFFRVENRVHTLEGTGLGLSIVRNIVEKHNSRIYIDSEVGVGTTFWFDLPVYEAKVIKQAELESKE